MKFIIGEDKFPLVEVKENIYLHIFPITKYQFERFLWNVSPEGMNYKKILEVSPRVSPFGLKKKKLSNLFITQISFEEAVKYAQWMKGKIPECDLIFEFEKKFRNLSFSRIKRLLSNYSEIDIRFWKLLNSFEKMHINNLGLLLENLDGGELCYTDSIFENNICIKKYGSTTTYELTGDEPQKIRWDHSFRISKEKEED